MGSILKYFSILILVAILITGFRIYNNLKDKDPGYFVDMVISNSQPSQLQTGFSQVNITPAIEDTWIDTNGDAQFNPDDGDTYSDGNANGRFDPVWMAGFGNRRAAAGIHDDLWARAMVIDDGKTRLAIVAIDAIGFMNNDVIDVREMLPAEAGITYLVIVSTHCHEVPDLLGLWGESYLKSGVNDNYISQVKEGIVQSVVEAAGNLRASRLEVSEDSEGAAHMVKDTRKPEIFDSGLRIIRAVDIETGATRGSLISWGNHPETLWSKNLLITSDFPHYVRRYVEEGIHVNDSIVSEGTGGITLYVNGAIGGLMTTHPSLAVKDPVTAEEYKQPSFEKADAQGKTLAMLALNAMKNPAAIVDTASISLCARSVILPIKNRFFRLGTMLGILNRGTTGWMKMRSELAVINIGPVSIATLPGEVYPEIVNGGAEAPAGNDFNFTVNNQVSIRSLMGGDHKFILGLANDEIGYILPESQWDEKEPFTYDNTNPPYGEENSLGPETATLISEELGNMLKILSGSVKDQ